MKNPNKVELYKLYLIIHLIFTMPLYESLQKCTERPYYFLVIDIILASDNLSYFKMNLLERI